MAKTELETFLRKNRDRFATIQGNLLSASGGIAVRTILVAGCRPRQGASVVATCLACALSSEGGARTVLLDACAQAPRLHDWFALSDGPGLSDLLDGSASMEQAVHLTSFPNLWLLPHGTAPAQPMHAARRSALARQIEALAERYEYVVIDTDALSSASSVTLLAPHVHGVLLVVQAATTRRLEVADARTRIEQAGGRVLGTVMNKARA